MDQVTGVSSLLQSRVGKVGNGAVRGAGLGVGVICHSLTHGLFPRLCIGNSPSSLFGLIGTSPYFFFFLGPHLQHIKVPKLGVEWELQLPQQLGI